MEIHRSARKHGVATPPSLTPSITRWSSSISNRTRDPPRVLAIGPDEAGNLLEIIWLEFPDRAPIVIHAMPLRRSFYDLLPSGEDDS